MNFFNRRRKHSLSTAGHRQAARAQPRFEVLEERQLLTAAPLGPEFQLEGPTAVSAKVARNAHGDYVGVWTDMNSSQKIVYAQRYHDDGTAIGNPVAIGASATQYPNAAIDDAGNFVVAWSRNSGGVNSISMRRFDADGTPVGLRQDVTQSDSSLEVVDLDLNNNGDVVVAWGGPFTPLFARVVSPVSASNVTQIASGGSFYSISINNNGRFVAIYQKTETYARYYDLNAQPIGDAFQVESVAAGWPTAQLNDDGKAVFSWSATPLGNSEVFMRRFDALGNPLADRIRVNTYTTGQQSAPSLGMQANGDFTIAWQSDSQDGSGFGIYAQSFLANGQSIGPEFLVNTVTDGYQTEPTLTMDPNGDYLVQWSPSRAQFYSIHAAPQVKGLTSQSGDVLMPGSVSTHLIHSITVDFSKSMDASNGAASVTNPTNWQFLVDGVDLSAQLGPIAWDPLTFKATITVPPQLANVPVTLRAKSTMQDDVGGGLDGDSDGLAGGEFTRTFSVREVAGLGEFRVNETTAGFQRSPSIAQNRLGDFIITWTDLQLNAVMMRKYGADGLPQSPQVAYGGGVLALSDNGNYVVARYANQTITASRYNASGMLLGAPTVVASNVTSLSAGVKIALDENDNFTVVWDSFVRRFDALGIALGPASYTDGYNSLSLAMNSHGSFVVGDSISGVSGNGVVIHHADGTITTFRHLPDSQQVRYLGIDANDNVVIGSNRTIQRYSAAGLPLGDPIADNLGDQLISLDVDSAGNILAVWVASASYGYEPSLTTDKALKAVVARRYDANGRPEGPAFRVNDYVLNDQLPTTNRSASLLDNGNFVIAWESNGQDGSDRGIYVQTFVDRSIAHVTDVISSSAERIEDQTTLYRATDSISVGFSHSLNLASATNVSHWQLLENGVDISSRIAGISYAANQAKVTLQSPLQPGNYELRLQGSLDANGVELDGDLDGLPGGGFAVQFSKSTTLLLGGEIHLLEDTARPVTANLAIEPNGEFAVAWDAFAAQSFFGSLRYFDSQGTPHGSSVHVGDGQFQTLAVDGLGNYTGIQARTSIYPSFGSKITAINAYQLNEQGSTGTFLVNSNTEQDHARPLMAMNAAGQFVVVWTNYGQDGNQWGVFGRRFDASGQPLGEDFQINTTGMSAATYATVAMGSEGEFVVVWPMPKSEGGASIVAQYFNADGTRRGNEIAVNSTTARATTYARVGMDSTGGFAVVWQDNANPGGVFYQRFDASGIRIQGEIRLNPLGQYAYNPNIGIDSEGRSLVVWEAELAAHRYAIYGQVLDSVGNKAEGLFQISTQPSSYLTGPMIAMNTAGDAVVSWLIGQPYYSTTPSTSSGFFNFAAQRISLGHPPVLDLNGPVAAGLDFNASVQQNGTPVALVDSQKLLVSDAPVGMLQGASISIVGTLPEDLLAVDTTGTNIVASFAGGVLSLSGADTPEHYQLVLRTATFSSTGTRLGNSQVQIDFVIDDGIATSPVATSRVTIYVPGSASVVGRYLAYNQSKFDGSDPAVNGLDDAAIATDKQAYLPGAGLSTFANVSSYTRGINSVIFDLAGLHGQALPEDFSFKIGTSNSPADWIAAPAPSEIVVRAGAGVDGADRYEIVWPNGAIVNTWLEITVAANVRTGLATPDVFYFGHRLGDTGGNPSVQAITNAADSLAIRFHPGANQSVTSLYDIDRNGLVSAADELAARSNPGTLKMLNLPPIVVATAQAAPQTVDLNAGDPIVGLAFALALGVKPLTATSVVRPLSVEPLAATVSQAAREAAVAAIIADERVAFDLSATVSQAGEESQSEDWLSLALD